MFNQYPYLNINDLNLDFVLNAIREMKYEVTNFVSINAIKYADPIQWNITSQYEKNTIVIDPVTGTAYISVAPVPSGVALTRPEYWTVVFDLGSFVTRAAQNFTSRWESETTTTATFPTTTGNWLIWGDVLYKALTNIIAGDTYVVGSNIEHFTIEDLYNAYLNTIANILSMVGDLADLTTSDTSNIVNAINSVVDAIGIINTDLQTLDNVVNPAVPLSTGANTITEAINELFETSNDIVVVRPTMTQAEIADIIATHHNVYFDGGNYYVEFTANGQTAYSTISDQKIILAKDAVINVVPNNYTNYYVFTMKNVNNVEISGGKIVGDRNTHTGAAGEWGHAFYILAPAKFIHIHDCEISYMWGDGVYMGESTNAAETVSEISLDHLNIHHVRRNGISVCEANGLYVSDIEVSDLIGGTYPMAGIDFEPNLDNRNIYNCNVSNFIVKNCYRATMVAQVRDSKVGINFNNVFAYHITGRMIEVTGSYYANSGIIRFSDYYGEDIGLPIKIFDHDATSFKIELENIKCHIVNIDTTDPLYYTAMNCLISIYSGGSFTGTSIGNISAKNVYADDNNNNYYAFIAAPYVEKVLIVAPNLVAPNATRNQKSVICQCDGKDCIFNNYGGQYGCMGSYPTVFKNYTPTILYKTDNHVFSSTDYELLDEIELSTDRYGQFPVMIDGLIVYNSGSPTGLKIVRYASGTESTLAENTSGGKMTLNILNLDYNNDVIRIYGKNTSASGNSDYALSIAF